jgi:hypothetical protein
MLRRRGGFAVGGGASGAEQLRRAMLERPRQLAILRQPPAERSEDDVEEILRLCSGMRYMSSVRRPEDQRALCKMLRYTFLGAGRIVVKEGDAGNEMYLVLSGRLRAKSIQRVQANSGNDGAMTGATAGGGSLSVGAGGVEREDIELTLAVMGPVSAFWAAVSLRLPVKCTGHGCSILGSAPPSHRVSTGGSLRGAGAAQPARRARCHRRDAGAVGAAAHRPRRLPAGDPSGEQGGEARGQLGLGRGVGRQSEGAAHGGLWGRHRGPRAEPRARDAGPREQPPRAKEGDRGAKAAGGGDTGRRSVERRARGWPGEAGWCDRTGDPHGKEGGVPTVSCFRGSPEYLWLMD